MNKLSHPFLLLASLSIVLMTGASCVRPITPVPATATPANSIQNIIWEWTNMTDQSTSNTTTVPNPQDYTITFRADGTLNGKADCNPFTGVYAQEAGFSITIGASTLAACGDASLDQQYLQLLSAIAAGGPDGAGNLALETAGGAQRMLFKNGGEAPAP